MTYTGPIDFLDFQASFDDIFGNDPAMLRHTNRSKGQYATEDTDYFRQKVYVFCNLCRLHIFVIPFNLRMLVPRSMTHKKCLRTFLFSCINSQ